jgi:dephospho-CoA kinase
MAIAPVSSESSHLTFPAKSRLGQVISLPLEIQHNGLIGITGPPFCGKSTVANWLYALADYHGHKVRLLNLEREVSQILLEISWEKYHPLRTALLQKYGKQILNVHGEICRTKLGKLIYRNPERLIWFQDKIRGLLIQKVAQLINGHTLVFLESRYLLESGLLPACRWVIHIDSDPDWIRENMAKRPLTSEQIERRLPANQPMTLLPQLRKETGSATKNGLSNLGYGPHLKPYDLKPLFGEICELISL